MKNAKYADLGEDRKIRVQEVTVRKVLSLVPFFSVGPEGQDEGEEGEVEKGFMDHLEELLKESTGLDKEDLYDMTSSELEALWDAFREVNGFFFRTLDRLGITEKLIALIGTQLEAYGETFAALLKGVMASVSTTDLAGLLPQLDTPETNDETSE